MSDHFLTAPPAAPAHIRAGLLGAIAGDMIGSSHEHAPITDDDFALFPDTARYTDDTVMTVAVADALFTDRDFTASLRRWGRRFPDAGYGAMFAAWLAREDRSAYGSWGNGAAMRAAPIGWCARRLNDVVAAAEDSARVTHDHDDGIAGARAVAVAIHALRCGMDPVTLRDRVQRLCGYPSAAFATHGRSGFDVSAAGSVPPALAAFVAADGYEQAVRNAVRLRGDADTQACIAGACAATRFGLPPDIERETLERLPEAFVAVIDAYAERFATASVPD